METRLIPKAPAAEGKVLSTLRAAGWHTVGLEDWHYPPGVEPVCALVRISVYGGQYQLWRRNRHRTGWMPIVVDDIEHFDQDAFHSWQATWPLSE